MFLFSGVFFPLSRLPDWLEPVAWVTPLFHGVELVRGLMLGTLTSPAWLLHVGYLVSCVTIGTVAAMWTLGWKLRK
jgi:lipooligosaccharide transport system permease protein